jgi:hypothetical protein
MPRNTTKATSDGAPATSGQAVEAKASEAPTPTALVTRLATRHGEVVGGKQEVKKHVAAIHTSGELGLVERKLVNILLLNAYDNLATVRQHRLPTKMLMAMLGWSEGDDTVHLRKALLRIVSTPVEFNLMESDTEPTKKSRWTATALLAAADLVNGFCEYEYSSRLAEELADPDVYAIINVGIQRQFNSGYALTLYENCLRYRRTGSTGWMTLEVFRKLMGATAPTYEDFRRLSELVIKKAEVEVNALSDIDIKAEYERKGRKVARIRFTVNEKAQQSVFSENERAIEDAKQSNTFQRLRAHGIGEKLAVAWVLTDEQRAKAALDITEQRARGGQIKASPAGYMRRLMDDKTIDLSSSTFEKKVKDEAAAQRAAETAAAEEKERSLAESQARGDKIRDLVKALTEEELKAYAAEYVAGEGAGQATTYNPATGAFKNKLEFIPFMNWLRKQIAEKNGLASDRNPPNAV